MHSTPYTTLFLKSATALENPFCFLLLSQIKKHWIIGTLHVMHVFTGTKSFTINHTVYMNHIKCFLDYATPSSFRHDTTLGLRPRSLNLLNVLMSVYSTTQCGVAGATCSLREVAIHTYCHTPGLAFVILNKQGPGPAV